MLKRKLGRNFTEKIYFGKKKIIHQKYFIFFLATQNASDDEAILGAILEAYPINRRYILNLFKHSVNITGIDRLIETQEKEEQIEYGKKHKLTFTPYFKKMLHNLTYSMYLYFQIYSVIELEFSCQKV